MNDLKKDYKIESERLALYDRIHRTVETIAIISLLLLCLSVLAHDPALNPKVPNIEAIEAMTFKLWAGFAVCASISWTVYMFIFKKRSQFIASVYKNSDESLAVENNWCPRCLGLMGSACPDHDFSQTSYKAHGINNRPYSMSIRDAKTTNPILYRYQQEQIEKTLQMFSIIFDKLDE